MDRGTNACNFLLGNIVPLRLGYVGVVNRSQEVNYQNLDSVHMRSLFILLSCATLSISCMIPHFDSLKSP